MSARYQSYEILPHTADLKIRAYGSSLPELFIHALQGMFEMLYPHKKIPITKVQRSVRVCSSKREYLLVEFLSECLYLSDVYDEAYDAAVIQAFSGTCIEALIDGYSITGFGGQEIKAVTYHDINIECVNGVWQATVVFDI